MPLLIAMGTFLAVFLTVYGLFLRTASTDPMEARLGGLRYSRPKKDNLPEPEAAFKARVIAPIMRTLSMRANSILPSTLTERLELSMVRAGLKIKPGQFIVVCGILAGVLPVLGVVYFAALGSGFQTLAMVFGALVGFGVYGPRIWLLGRIKRRQKAIWRSLPDAFDLITASVEAGLGIDAAFTRVLEKVDGPFAEELGRTMREITVGRSRREAFLDMANRTGVEELRSLINAVIQAEVMGISIGGVIRVQTGVIRTKRRQHAEEQAFKAPIKMVFPLVFFIFPAIMVVIGGPAVIQIMDSGFGG
jgi:tight adherence protein C